MNGNRYDVIKIDGPDIANPILGTPYLAPSPNPNPSPEPQYHTPFSSLRDHVLHHIEVSRANWDAVIHSNLT